MSAATKLSILGVLISLSTLSASAQQNLGHFYMARQQIQITDDAPVVTRKSDAGGGAAGGNGALPNSPVALPRAGWVPYSQSVPALSTNLPKTNNGVPQKAPPTPPNGMRGRTGKLRTPAPAKASAPPPTGPAPVKSYEAYKQYAPQSPASGSAAMNSNANVQGSLLHWARKRRSAGY